MSLGYRPEGYIFGYLNTGVDDFNIQATEAVDFNNCDLNTKGQRGTLKRRLDLGGTFPDEGVASPTALPVTALHTYIQFNGQQNNIWISDGKMYEDDAASGTLKKSGLSTTEVMTFDRAVNGLLYMTNVTDGLKSYDGTTVVDSPETAGTPIVAKYVISHKSHLLLANASGSENTLQYSVQGDPNDYTTGSLTDIGVSGTILFDNEITGIVSHSSAALVFLRSSIHTIEGEENSTFEKTLFDPGIGCINHHSIVKAEGNIFFISDNGFYAIAGLSRPVPISNSIKGTFNSIRSGNLEHISGTYDAVKREVLWIVNLVGTDNDTTTVTLANCILVYELETGRWKKWLLSDGFLRSSGIYIEDDITAAPMFGNAVGRNLNLFGTTGIDYVDESTTSVATFLYETKTLDQGFPSIEKIYDRLRVYYKPATVNDKIDIVYSTDRDSEQTKTLTLTRQDNSARTQSQLDALPFVYGDIPLNVRGLYIKIKFKNNSSDDNVNMQLFKYEILYKPGQTEMNKQGN